MKKTLVLFSLFLSAAFFFIWGIFTERNKVFPYAFLDFIKSSTYDFFTINDKSDREPVFEKYHIKLYMKLHYLSCLVREIDAR